MQAYTEDTFWGQVAVRGQDECWPWLGPQTNSKRNKTQYGRVGYQGGQHMAHRIALEIHLKRPIQKGLFALHSCDNTLCCNPAHLHEGTHKDNMREARERGRFEGNGGYRWNPVGQLNGRAKLKPEEREEVALRYSTGNWTQEELARVYRVSQMTISNVVRKRRDDDEGDDF